MKLNIVGRIGIMRKKKSVIIAFTLLLVLVFMILLFSRSKLYYENYSLKNRQGEIINRNVMHVFGTVYDAKKDLTNKNTSNLDRYFWQFNEFNRLELPRSIAYYTINIRSDYGELIRLIENNSSQKEINEVKNMLDLHLSRLEAALRLIIKDCLGTDNIKFYLLDSEDNETMKNVLKILTTEDNHINK